MDDERTTEEAPAVQEEAKTVEVPASEPAAAAPTAAAAAPQPAPAPAPAPEPAPDLSRYQRIVKSLGEIPESPSDQLLDSIDEKTIENMPANVRGLLKHLMAQQNVEHQKRMSDFLSLIHI